MIIEGSKFAIGRLASGLDSARIIDQLMQVESRGRVKLEWEHALWTG